VNIQALKRVAQYILDEPQGFLMEEWCAVSEDSPCGTNSCIGGTAAMLDNPRQYMRWLKDQSQDEVRFAATHALGLTESQAGRLFYLKDWSDDEQGWPASFSNRYNRATTPKARARIAFERIHHFIKTKGKE
jgi:hypothetical protein